MQSRRLPTLIAIIDHLERRLYGGHMPDGDVLSDQELLGALHVVGQQYLSNFRADVLELQRFKPEEELQKLLAAQSGKHALSIRHIAILQAAEVAFRFIETSTHLHSHVYAALQGLQIGFAKTLITDPITLIQPDQPHRKFLEFLAMAFKGYDQYAGRRAYTLVCEASKRVAETVAPNMNDIDACQAARKALTGLLHRYNRESAIYEKSLITKEHGSAARDDVRLLVNQEILNKINGKSLPPDVLKFFQEIWSKYLHVIYLREGPDSEIWKQSVGVIPILVRSMYIQDPYEMLQFYQNDLANALALVHSGVESIHQDTQLTQNVLTYLDELPLQLIQKGKKPDTSIFKEVPLPSQTSAHLSATLSDEDIEAMDAMRLGEWFFIRNEEHEIRGKLIQKDTTLSYCLFANLSGIKAARIEANGLATAIKNGMLKHIETSPIVDLALESALTQLEDQVQRLELKVHEAEQEREQARAVEEEAAHLKRMRDEIKREEMEASERERKIAEAQLQAREVAKQQEQARTLEKILSDVQMLQPGGWLELLDKDNVKQICKLALKLKSTQKMIFVDRFGQKIAEMRPADLAARIVEGSARIIDHGIAFEDTLQSLILDRSGKINVE